MTTEAPRAYTAEEVRAQILTHIAAMSKYWAEVPGQSIQDRCDGVAFSILTMMDGCTMALPQMDLKLNPHPEDQEFCKSKGENWFEPGMEVGGALHEEISRYVKARG